DAGRPQRVPRLLGAAERSQEAGPPLGAPAETDRERRDRFLELFRGDEAVAQAELSLRELPVQLGRLLEQRNRLCALLLLAEHFALTPVADREPGVHLLRELEVLGGLLVLVPAQEHLP